MAWSWKALNRRLGDYTFTRPSLDPYCRKSAGRAAWGLSWPSRNRFRLRQSSSGKDHKGRHPRGRPCPAHHGHPRKRGHVSARDCAGAERTRHCGTPCRQLVGSPSCRSPGASDHLIEQGLALAPAPSSPARLNRSPLAPTAANRIHGAILRHPEPYGYVQVLSPSPSIVSARSEF